VTTRPDGPTQIRTYDDLIKRCLQGRPGLPHTSHEHLRHVSPSTHPHAVRRVSVHVKKGVSLRGAVGAIDQRGGWREGDGRDEKYEPHPNPSHGTQISQWVCTACIQARVYSSMVIWSESAPVMRAVGYAVPNRCSRQTDSLCVRTSKPSFLPPAWIGTHASAE